MSKLTYWKLPVENDDSFAYSERFATKREAMDVWNAMEESHHCEFYGEVRTCEKGCNYLAPEKVTIYYTGGTFGLLKAIANERHNDF